MEGDDTSAVLVRFENGVVGTFVESFVMKSLVTAAGGEVHTVRVDGELGSMQVNDRHIIEIYSENTNFWQDEAPVQHNLYVPDQNSFDLEVEHFLDCVQTGNIPLTDGRVMRRPLEIVLACYHSMETGQPVQL